MRPSARTTSSTSCVLVPHPSSRKPTGLAFSQLHMTSHTWLRRVIGQARMDFSILLLTERLHRTELQEVHDAVPKGLMSVGHPQC